MSKPIFQFPFLVEVLSPLHIGTEAQLNRMETVIRGQSVYVIDERRLLAIIKDRKRIESFIEFAEQSHPKIGAYLQRQNIDLNDVTAYRLPLIGQRPGRSSIQPFIKQPGIPPRPYIPGSTLKGALRTAFLQAHLDNPEAVSQAEAQVRAQMQASAQGKWVDDKLEADFFGSDPHHDWMRVVQISDTGPVDIDQLSVVEVRVCSKKHNNRFKPKNFAIYPEVLLPDSHSLRGDITVNSYLLNSDEAKDKLDYKRARQHMASLPQNCNRAAGYLIQNEIAFYERLENCDSCDRILEWYRDLQHRHAKLSPSDCLLCLGWGSGYESQGILSNLSKSMQDKVRLEYSLGKIIQS